MLGKVEGRRRRGRQRMKWLDGIINSMDMNLSKLRGRVEAREAWPAAVHRVPKSQMGLTDLAATTKVFFSEAEGTWDEVWPGGSL